MRLSHTLHGYKVGIVTNNGILFSESSLERHHFVELWSKRNTTDFPAKHYWIHGGKAYEAGGIAKDGAKLVTAVSCVNVPKFTVIVGGSHGAGNYGMCGRAYDPRFVHVAKQQNFCYGRPTSGRCSHNRQTRPEGERGQEPMEGEELEAFRAPILEKYETEGSPYYSTARLLG